MARGRERRTMRRKPHPVEIPTTTAAEALIALGHFAEDNLPATAPDDGRGPAGAWTMAELKPECLLVEYGRESRETYDRALLTILDRYPLVEANFEPVLRDVPDGQLFEAERRDALEAGDLADLAPRRRAMLARSLGRRLCGIPRPGVPGLFPPLLRRLLASRGAGDVWMLGAEDSASFDALAAAEGDLGAIYLDESTGACAQAILRVLGSTAEVGRVAHLSDLPLDDELNPLGYGGGDASAYGDGESSAPTLATLVGTPESLPSVIANGLRDTVDGDGDYRRAYAEWSRLLGEAHPGVSCDDSLTIAVARELLPPTGGFAALLSRMSLLTGLRSAEFRRDLVEENLVRAVVQFDIAEHSNLNGTYDLWVLDTDRTGDDPVYLMRLEGQSQRERFPHLYDAAFDEELGGTELDRIVDAIMGCRTVPFVGAPIERERILDHPTASLRLVDYESSVDVGRSLREHGGSGDADLRDLMETYRAGRAKGTGDEAAFLKGYDEYLDFLNR